MSCSLERGKRLGDAVRADRVGFKGERRGKHVRIALVVAHAAKELVFHAGHAELDGIFAEHGDEGLLSSWSTASLAQVSDAA